MTLDLGVAGLQEGQQRASVDSNGSPNISPLSENSDAAYELTSDTDEADQSNRHLLGNSHRKQSREAPRSSFKWHQRLVPCIFLLFLAIYVFGYHVGPTEMFDKLKSTFKSGSSESSSAAAASQGGNGGMRNIAYFTNWAIYG